MADIAALIVAAGRGERAGGAIPKQYQPILGSPMLRLTVRALKRQSRIRRIRVMIGPDQEQLYREAMAGLDVPAPLLGGATRQESVRRGLEALEPDKPDYVLIHDAARPLVGQKVIGGVIDALEGGAAAAVPMVAVTDTLRRHENDGRWTLVPRERLHRAQTPQGFRFAEILDAHRRFATRDVTDDMALAELAGLAVSAVAGDERNLKVTTAEDFSLAEKLLSDLGDVRTGFGYDAHRFRPGDHVWLCGVKVAHDHGLEGHSDADAGLHALTDAILATIGAGDIGIHFPPTDPTWRGAPSWKFLDHAAGLVRAKGGQISHCDITLICERPKIGPHREAMRERIAEILCIESSRVSVKATTTEGMGFTGRKEGLAAQAVATVRLP